MINVLALFGHAGTALGALGNKSHGVAENRKNNGRAADRSQHGV